MQWARQPRVSLGSGRGHCGGGASLCCAALWSRCAALRSAHLDHDSPRDEAPQVAQPEHPAPGSGGMVHGRGERRGGSRPPSFQFSCQQASC